MTQVRTDCEGFHRRDFLKLGAAGVFGLSLPQLLQLEAQASTNNPNSGSTRRANSVILLWLAGGPATIDMWDLRPNAPSNIRGEFNQIATSANGIQISEALPPGETTNVTVNAPAGTYQFYCNLPGHRAAGMFGTLTVN